MENHSLQLRIAQAFTENRERLLALVRRNLKPVLLKRMSYEDVLSTVYENAAKRLAYFSANEDVPIYFKFRTILLQTITDLERRFWNSPRRFCRTSRIVICLRFSTRPHVRCRMRVIPIWGHSPQTCAVSSRANP